MAKAMPIQIRGVVYPSARSAAEALGVSPSTVYSAICQGKADRIGLWGSNVVRAKDKARAEAMQKAVDAVRARLNAHTMLKHPGWQDRADECRNIVELLTTGGDQ